MLTYLIAVLLSTVAFGAESDARLSDATRKGDRAAVRSLLQEKVDVNAPGKDGTTALHWAVRANDLETVELLIRAGATVKAPDRYGVIPLYLAAVPIAPSPVHPSREHHFPVRRQLSGAGVLAIFHRPAVYWQIPRAGHISHREAACSARDRRMAGSAPADRPERPA